MNAPVTRLAQRRRAEHEVDAHAAVALEALTVVVPVGVDLGAGRVRTHDVGPPVVDEGLERRTLARSHVGAGRVDGRVEDVDVLGGDVPVADQRHVVAEPGPGRRLQLGQPVELVEVVGVVDLAAVGHVERPDPQAAARRADRARLDAGGLAPRGLAVEADLDVLETDPAHDRHAVPLVQAGHGDVVAQRLDAHQRQLVLARLGLLQREHVDLVPLQECLDPVDPGAQRVDVPGRDPHPPHTSERAPTRRTTMSWTRSRRAIALIQFALWGVALAVIGGSIAAATWPHTDGSAATPATRPASGSASSSPGSADCCSLVPVVAWGAKLGREAWPPPAPLGSRAPLAVRRAP